VLACTHYPLLLQAFVQVVPSGVNVLDPSAHIADKLVDWLQRHPGFVEPGTGRLKVLCTGHPEVFRRHGKRFLGAEIPVVEHIAEERGRLAHRDEVLIRVGQVVRQ
jgi:glutamate racemase